MIVVSKEEEEDVDVSARFHDLLMIRVILRDRLDVKRLYRGP